MNNVAPRDRRLGVVMLGLMVPFAMGAAAYSWRIQRKPNRPRPLGNAATYSGAIVYVNAESQPSSGRIATTRLSDWAFEDDYGASRLAPDAGPYERQKFHALLGSEHDSPRKTQAFETPPLADQLYWSVPPSRRSSPITHGFGQIHSFGTHHSMDAGAVAAFTDPVVPHHGRLCVQVYPWLQVYP